MRHGIRAEAAILALLVLAAIAPFSNRAVFADEHIYLRLARSALERPLFPADTPLLFFGIQRPNSIGHTHPPAVEYYLAGVYALLGRFSEVPFRLLFAVFPIMAVLAFYSLARRFTSEPFFVTALFAASPAFFVLAPTLMMDVPIVALLLLGLALYFRGWLVGAAISFTLAAGAGYAALVPLACLGIIMLLSRRPLKEIACVAAAPLVLGLWLLAMTIHFGTFPLGETFSYLALNGFAPKSTGQLIQDRLRLLSTNLLGTLSFLGGVLVFPGMIRLKKTKSLLAALGLALLLSFLAPSGMMPSLLFRLWFIALAACGIMLLAAFAGAAAQTIRAGANGGEPVLILWVPTVLVFFLVVGEMVTARYLLLALPAIYLIIFREARRADLIATLVPTLVLSVVLAYADMAFVNSYRTWVRNAIPMLQEQGFRVYGAAESGLRFYLESAGADTLVADDRRPAGSDIIIRQAVFEYGLGADIEVMLTELKSFPLEGSFPVRTMGTRSHPVAGFWDSNSGLVPFVLSSQPYDVVRAVQVNPLVQHFPQASTDPEQAPVFGGEGRPIFKLSEGERLIPMRIPGSIQIQYELAGGEGAVEQTSAGLKLINRSGTTLEWRRLRFTPLQWMD
jgi:4-amino-4-deoxy-L-arabinose transferase-like glycosyltransferase